MSLKYFVELPCDNVEDISAEIYKFLEINTDLINSDKFGWNFIECKQLLSDAPLLLQFFKEYKLIPRHAAITIVADNTHLPKHIDELPVVAKINFPVINVQGWANRWYDNDQMVAELLDMKLPIAFNSQVVHSVEKTTATILPRMIASFTFHNEPLELLQ
jgi:hypothetical protein